MNGEQGKCCSERRSAAVNTEEGSDEYGKERKRLRRAEVGRRRRKRDVTEVKTPDQPIRQALKPPLPSPRHQGPELTAIEFDLDLSTCEPTKYKGTKV
ncbi:hypothetical protein B296_00044767 [Ensete ventricosum]|uniref:Uncharacterized protein n=1 Tax=Ensete ventricosum TaxID=4639 RepID=A0A426Z9Q9_ENSVE|nr:hypothetical protein B296_00044767 [Ensete ventricosum]